MTEALHLFFFFICLNLLSFYVYFASPHVRALCMCCPWEAIVSPRTGVGDPCGCWELNLDCLKEQVLLPKTSPALNFFLLYIFLKLCFWYVHGWYDRNVGGQRKSLRSWFFAFTIWDLGIESRSPVFIVIWLIYSVILLALNYFLNLFVWFLFVFLRLCLCLYVVWDGLQLTT